MKSKSLFAAGALLLITAIAGLATSFDWEKAVSLYKQGQYRAAIVEFQNVVAEFPNHADSWKFIGLAYYQLKEYERAMPALEKALALKKADGKTDSDLLLALSRVQISLKKYDQALPFLENLTKQRPDLAANQYMLGVAYANLNRNEEAITAFRAAAKLAPQDADAWQYLSLQQLKLGRTVEAISSLRSGLVAAPKNVEMTSLLTEALLRQGASETSEVRANALYEEAIRVATSLRTLRDDAVSSELLGRAYLAAKKYPPAEQSLQRSLTLNKQPTAALYFNLAFAQAQNKVWAQAAENFVQADKLKPNNVDTLYYLGFVYENLHRYQLALEAYTRAFEASGQTNEDLKASIKRVAPFAKPQ